MPETFSQSEQSALVEVFGTTPPEDEDSDEPETFAQEQTEQLEPDRQEQIEFRGEQAGQLTETKDTGPLFSETEQQALDEILRQPRQPSEIDQPPTIDELFTDETEVDPEEDLFNFAKRVRKSAVDTASRFAQGIELFSDQIIEQAPDEAKPFLRVAGFRPELAGEVSDFLQDYADSYDLEPAKSIAEFDGNPWENLGRALTDPEFLSQNVAEQVPIMASLMIPGAGATSLGLRLTGSRIAAGLAGTALQTPLEGVLEAVDTFRSCQEGGGENCTAKANETLAGNIMALTGSNALQWAVATLPFGRKMGSNVFSRILQRAGTIGFEAVSEGAEEVVQEGVIQPLALENKIDVAGPESAQGFLMGGLFGGLLGAGAETAASITQAPNRIAENLQQDPEIGEVYSQQVQDVLNRVEQGELNPPEVVETQRWAQLRGIEELLASPDQQVSQRVGQIVQDTVEQTAQETVEQNQQRLDELSQRHQELFEANLQGRIQEAERQVQAEQIAQEQQAEVETVEETEITEQVQQPEALDDVPGIGPQLRNRLLEQGIATPQEFAEASDETLLDVKGIGETSLEQIRGNLGTEQQEIESPAEPETQEEQAETQAPRTVEREAARPEEGASLGEVRELSEQPTRGVERIDDISGLDETQVVALEDAGFDTVDRLEEATVDELTDIPEINEPQADQIKEEVDPEPQPQQEFDAVRVESELHDIVVENYLGTQKGADEFRSDFIEARQQLADLPAGRERQLQDVIDTPFTAEQVAYLDWRSGGYEGGVENFFLEKRSELIRHAEPDTSEEDQQQVQEFRDVDSEQKVDWVLEADDSIEDVILELETKFQEYGRPLDTELAIQVHEFLADREDDFLSLSNEEKMDRMEQFYKLFKTQGASQNFKASQRDFGKFPKNSDEFVNTLDNIVEGVTESLGIEFSDQQVNEMLDSLRLFYERELDEINRHRGGVKTWEQTWREATNLRMTTGDFLSYLNQDRVNLTGPEFVALMSHVVSVQTAIGEISLQIRDEQGGKATRSQVNDIQRLMEINDGLLKVLAAAKAETGRQLNIQKMVVHSALGRYLESKGDTGEPLASLGEQQRLEDRGKNMSFVSMLQTIKDTEGVELTDEIIEDAHTIDITDEVEVRDFFKKHLPPPSAAEKFDFWWTNNVLSGPRTFGRNIFGSFGLTAGSPIRRVGEAIFDSLAPDVEGYDQAAFADVLEDIKGAAQATGAFADSLGVKETTGRLREETDITEPSELLSVITEFQAMSYALPQAFADSYRAWRWGLTRQNRETMDYWAREPYSDNVHRTLGAPLRFMLAQDQFFRSVGRQQEMRVRLVRRMRENPDLEVTDENVARQIEEVSQDIAEQAEKRGAMNVLQPKTVPGLLGNYVFDQLIKADQQLNRGEVIKKTGNKAVDAPLFVFEQFLGKLPKFMRTAGTIVHIGTQLHPVVGPFTAMKNAVRAHTLNNQEDVAATDLIEHMEVSRRDAGLAGLGLAITFATLPWVMNGLLTGAGPDDWEERKKLYRNGWRPYSFYAPFSEDNYISYRYLFPLSMPLAFAANFWESLIYGDSFASAAIGLDATKFTGQSIADFVDLLTDNVKTGLQFLGEQSVMFTFSRWAKLLMDEPVRGNPVMDPLIPAIPFVGMWRTLAQAEDPRLKDPQDFYEILKQPIPKSVREVLDPVVPGDFSQDVTVMKDRFGNSITFDSPLGAFGAFVPAAVSRSNIENLTTFQENLARSERIRKATRSSLTVDEFETQLASIENESLRNYVRGEYWHAKWSQIDPINQSKRAAFSDRLEERGHLNEASRKHFLFAEAAESGKLPGKLEGARFSDRDRNLLYYKGDFLAEEVLNRLSEQDDLEDRVQSFQEIQTFLKVFKFEENVRPKMRDLIKTIREKDKQQNRGVFTFGAVQETPTQ